MASTQIDGGKQIRAATITNAEIAAAAAIATSKLADSANFILRGGSVAFTADQSMGGFKLTNLGAPTADSDAARKQDVDAAKQGLDIKDSCRVATTEALPANTFAANALTADANGVLTVDGVATVLNDRILVKNEAAGLRNGLYYVSTEGTAGVPYVLTRVTDANTSAKVTSGMFTFIEEGTTNDNTGWVLSTNNPITLNTTALAFSQFSSAGTITAGAGLTKTGDTIDVIAGDTSLTVNANELHVTLGDASLEVSSGLRVKQGTSGQVYIASAGGVLTPVTMGGDATIIADGTLTVAATVYKAANFVTRETPSGAVNGSNVTYTLANTPTAGTEEVFLNGIQQEPGAGNDYTISGGTITYLTAPISGDKIRVNYRK